MFSDEKLREVSRRYREDGEFRRRLDETPRLTLQELGIKGDTGVAAMDVELHEAQRNEFHICLPPNPNRELAEGDLALVGGQIEASTLGTVLTLSSIPSCIGSIGTASSVNG